MRGNDPISKDLDWLTIFLYLGLVGYGCISIYSAVYNPFEEQSVFDFSTKAGTQLIWVFISFIIAVLILIVDFRIIFGASYPLYAFFVFLLVCVLLFGIEVNGAKAWFQIGSVRIMPAEFSKIGIALALAKFMDDYPSKLGMNKNTGILLLIVAIPALIILKQNETGTVLIFTSIIIMLFREDLSPAIPLYGLVVVALFVITLAHITYDKSLLWVYLGVDILGSVIFLFGIWIKKKPVWIMGIALIAGMTIVIYSTQFIVEEVLQPHQQKRLISMIDPEKDPQESGYQTLHSKKAISTGGFSGKGYLQGNLTQGDYIPEQHTDFIFTTLGEERGFKGAFVFIILYLGFLIRLIFIAERQKSRFARVFGYVTIGIIFWHFMVNIGMTIGLFPVIGIPLPFFSYGGSSLLSFTIMIFVFLKLDMHRSQILARNN